MPAALPFLHLDTLWLQITGTLCNIACRHCFISCGPAVERHRVMSVAQVENAIRQAQAVGCRAYYFTGGEPFLHPDILVLIERALAAGPLGILTNGMLITTEIAEEIGRLFQKSEYSLDLRISLDGLQAAENDALRGKGAFEAACKGIHLLAEAGVEPTLAVTTVYAESGSESGRLAFFELLKSLGVKRPRVKLIPPFRLGREARRAGPSSARWVEAEELGPETPWILQCGTSRMVAAEGWYSCPILINEEGAWMGNTLAETMRPASLGSGACRTCLEEGFSCRT